MVYFKLRLLPQSFRMVEGLGFRVYVVVKGLRLRFRILDQGLG